MKKLFILFMVWVAPLSGQAYVSYHGADSVRICEMKRNAYNRLLQENVDNSKIQAKEMNYLQQAKEWDVSILDSAIGSEVKGTSLALDSKDNPHIAYEKHGTKIIYVSYNPDSSKWVSDLPLGGERPSLALDSLGYPHISSWYNGLRYWVKSDSGWNATQVYPGAWVDWTSIAIDKKGRPHIGWAASLSGADVILHSYWNDTNWVTEIIDTVIGDWGFVSIALDDTNNPHLAYGSDGWNTGLRYAKKTSNNWKIERVDTPSCGVNSMKINADGKPCIAYEVYKITYAVRETSGWVIDTIGTLGRESSLFIDKNNNPHISYLSQTANLFWLTYIWKDSNNIWHSEQLDSFTMGFPNLSATSIAIDNNGYAHISYRGTTGTNESNRTAVLKYAKGKGTGVEEKSNIKNPSTTLRVNQNPFTKSTELRVESKELRVESKEFRENKIEIYDIAGKLIETQSITQSPNNAITKISIGEKLKSGIYFVKVNDYTPVKVVKMNCLK
ncbi:MAG: T9SS type A sorting domain-containing protein [bacterium]